MKSAIARPVKPYAVAGALFLLGVVLHVLAGYLLLEHGWSFTFVTAGAVLAVFLGLLAEAAFGIAVHAAGWDSVALRALTRFNIPNTAVLRARLSASHDGVLSTRELHAILEEDGVEVEGPRVKFASFSGVLESASSEVDGATTLTLTFESNERPLKSVDEAIESFQDRMQELKIRLNDGNMHPQEVEFSLANVQLEHWNSPINDVAVAPTGASWTRQLKPREAKRLRQYLMANVELD